MGSQPGLDCQAASEGEGPSLGSFALVLRLQCGGEEEGNIAVVPASVVAGVLFSVPLPPLPLPSTVSVKEACNK